MMFRPRPTAPSASCWHARIWWRINARAMPDCRDAAMPMTGISKSGTAPMTSRLFQQRSRRWVTAWPMRTARWRQWTCLSCTHPVRSPRALVTEAIGLFAKGEGCRAARDGISGPGGARPVNTSGGCLARGHPPSLTGLYGLLECAEQVTGRAGARQVTGARRALHTCEGGNYNLALAHMLEGIGP